MRCIGCKSYIFIPFINQKWFRRNKIIELVSSAIIPFIAGFGDIIPFSKWLLGGLGVVISIAAGISSLYKFQENWIQYRKTAETLKQEKMLYLTETEPYNQDDKFYRFVRNIESIISTENRQWAQFTKVEKKNQTT